MEAFMPLTLHRRSLMLTAAAAGLVTSLPASKAGAATTHEVQMLNVHPENRRLRQVFLPRLIVVQPGDTVRFVATDKTHNSASIDGMIPEGAAEWKGKINDDVEATIDVAGFYGYQCTPHASTGMVGLIVAQGDGMMDNYDAAKGVRQRGRARAVWEEIWEEVDAMDFTA